MTPAAKAVIAREMCCSCGGCEGAVQDILRMEAMPCHGGRTALGRRRLQLRRVETREKRRPCFCERYAAGRSE